MYTIMHGLVDFPYDTDFEVILSRFTNSGVKPVLANMRSAFE